TAIQWDDGFTLGLIAFTAAVLGGIGNLPGAVLGGLLIGLIYDYNEGLSWHAPGSSWSQTIVFGILILILVFRPQGLLGERTPEAGWVARHHGRVYSGFFRLLEGVGLKDARARWERQSPFLQRALPPLVIAAIVIVLALPFRTPDPAAMVFLAIVYALYVM